MDLDGLGRFRCADDWSEAEQERELRLNMGLPRNISKT